MNSVGIDVSKAKSTIAVMRPFGEIVSSPFDVNHTVSELKKLADYLLSLPGETRIIMEYTGKYYQPIANYLRDAGLFVSVVHTILIHNYGKSSIRRVKTDKADAIKISNYGLDRWLTLIEYSSESEVRLLLKSYNRQYNHYNKLKIMLKNNLISLLDQTFPGVNTMFSSKPRKDGYEKWVDFVAYFWHHECVCGTSETAFKSRYAKWCKRAGYKYSESKAKHIYTKAYNLINVLPKNKSTKELITLAVSQLIQIIETLATTRSKMHTLATSLPEYSIVMNMCGVGEVLGPQLMAEIGDVNRFARKQSLIAFAGIDAPPYQSGDFDSKSRRISKRGSPALRKTLFQVMDVILKTSPTDDAVFQFLDKKRSEGKHYYVYMIAGANKFLRIYYARIKEHLYASSA